ncbi:4'-phosphopantetheinyl transferase family protein [Streptomyces nondiastaticus]|uniref:4'-phosphopantetheinyl transferase family protein n=1 Tax=Streptomyces nondiastaticus TaxID=3154512 RepID=A0ABW6TUG8_9ACTN
MSTADALLPAPPRPRAARLAGETLTLDPARPLHLAPLDGGLTAAVVSIAWLRARGDAARAALEARHLTDDEAERAAGLRRPERRYEWLAGRLAVKHGVLAHGRRHGHRTGRTRDIRVGAVAHGLRAGRPVVNAPVDVGLSHSGDFAVAVCGPRPVGVDLEHERRMPPLLAGMLTAGDHRVAAHADPDRRRLATMPLPLRWACKEAVLKHYGFGLRVDPREVALHTWHQDHGFTWRPGPGLLCHAPSAGDTRPHGWARRIDGYFLALVWT